jgi:hypothetical protein
VINGDGSTSNNSVNLSLSFPILFWILQKVVEKE